MVVKITSCVESGLVTATPIAFASVPVNGVDEYENRADVG
jgi:hypothetical protein